MLTKNSQKGEKVVKMEDLKKKGFSQECGALWGDLTALSKGEDKENYTEPLMFTKNFLRQE